MVLMSLKIEEMAPTGSKVMVEVGSSVEVGSTLAEVPVPVRPSEVGSVLDSSVEVGAVVRMPDGPKVIPSSSSVVVGAAVDDGALVVVSSSSGKRPSGSSRRPLDGLLLVVGSSSVEVGVGSGADGTVVVNPSPTMTVFETTTVLTSSAVDVGAMIVDVAVSVPGPKMPSMSDPRASPTSARCDVIGVTEVLDASEDELKIWRLTWRGK
jgi:hypothetical protein